MYNHRELEPKWQAYWMQHQTFATTNDHHKKFYVLDMFPYPSGSGLHVGHPEGYTATDIVARYKRLNGFDVLHPIGWDAFGLPAEQYALKTGHHPQPFTQKNIKHFRSQLQALGFSYDYRQEVDTTDPAYYRTTQLIFKKLYEQGLAEIRLIDVNWCQELGTGLANEEVVVNKQGQMVSEVGGFLVVKKPMRQWVLKITKYASRLYDDLDLVDWPSSLVALQRNWIKNEDGSLHLKDWIFSRQRYWGEPFPIAFDEDGEILLIDRLPLELPHLETIKPSGNGESPLALATDWLFFDHNGKRYRRETNTMPQWAGSCWYYLGYILKQTDGTYLDLESKQAKQLFKKWLPVDLYVGGQEHAVLHLLYARFWHKVLFDIGIVPTPEPFLKIVNQGIILGPDGQKMSKSKGNVINPDDIINEFGADTLRLYEMFLGPLEDTKPWANAGAKNIRKWLERTYRCLTSVITISPVSKVKSSYHALIKNVTADIETLKFNVAISKMMVFINDLYKNHDITLDQVEGFLVIFSVFAPHLGEELLAHFKLKPIHKQTWPSYDAKQIVEEKIIVAVQVNGKLRGTITPKNSETKAQLIARAKALANVERFLDGAIVKQIYVPNKIINFVVKK